MKLTKRKSRRSAFAAMLAVGLAVLSAGCQSVPISYTEPARLDMRRISKIGIISNDSEAAAQISTELVNTSAYTIATRDEVNELLLWQRQQRLLRDAVETNAEDIIKSYSENEMRANTSYQKKPLKISGIVTEIKQHAVRLGVGNDSVDVYIEKSEIGKAAALAKGTSVIMVGICYGLDVPDLRDMGELFSILGGGKHVNIANAMFYAPEYEGVDALLTLETTPRTNIESRDVEKKKPVLKPDGSVLKDDEGKIIYRSVKITEFRKIASVTIAYELVRFDELLIGRDEVTGHAQSTYEENRSKLPSDDSLISSAKKRPIKKIISDMIPTERTLSVKLIKSNSKDKEVKNAMNEAKKLVSEKDYAGAAEAYGNLYAKTKDFAAGYNQAVLTEAAQGTDKAVVLMEALAASSGDPQAQSMLAEMQRRNAANQQSAEQLKK